MNRLDELTDNFEMEQFAVPIIRAQCEHHISESMARSFIPDVSVMFDEVARSWRIRLVSPIAGNMVGAVKVRQPRTWWDHYKRGVPRITKVAQWVKTQLHKGRYTFLPVDKWAEWIRQTFIAYEEVDIYWDVAAVLPGLDIPEELRSRPEYRVSYVPYATKDRPRNPVDLTNEPPAHF